MINRIITRAKLKASSSAGLWAYWNVYGELCTENGKRHPMKIVMPHSVHQYYNIIQIQNIIDSKTIGQFTGFADKNGAKIFEGDFLSLPLDDEGESLLLVAWCADAAAFCLYEKMNGEVFPADAMDKDIVSEMTIVGNIFDNPELLEGEE